jgi:hypothetical protein
MQAAHGPLQRLLVDPLLAASQRMQHRLPYDGGTVGDRQADDFVNEWMVATIGTAS